MVAYLSLFVGVTIAADADPINDFCVADLTSQLKLNELPCISYANVTEDDFALRLFGKPGNISASPFGFSILPGLAGINYPGLNTMGMAIARIDVGPFESVPPHTHPHATELFYVMEGSFNTGFVDSTDTLFATNLTKGDVFVFPRGLLHFALSTSKGLSTAIVTFNSQNPLTKFVAPALFESNIPDVVLEKAFFISKATVHQMKKTLSLLYHIVYTRSLWHAFLHPSYSVMYDQIFKFPPVSIIWKSILVQI